MPTFKWIVRMQFIDDGRAVDAYIGKIYATATEALEAISQIQIGGLHSPKWLQKPMVFHMKYFFLHMFVSTSCS